MFTLGLLTAVAASERPELLSEPALRMLQRLCWLDRVGVVDIDPAISDTAATKLAFALDDRQLANCVVVGGRREGDDRVAGCVVLASTRADVNGTVRRLLDVRKASFLPMDAAVEQTGMEYGGITPVGLPEAWAVLVDAAVVAEPLVIIGSGVRRSKILLPGALLAELPGARVVEGLGRPMVGPEVSGFRTSSIDESGHR